MTSDTLIQIAYKVKKLRYKYKNSENTLTNRQNSDTLTRLIHSISVLYGYDDFTSVMRAINRRGEKKKRVNRYLRDMAIWYDKLHFVTLTFDDDALQRLSERTRHRYAQTWLNENCRDYFANVDYGKKNGREHFHAVAVLNRTRSEWKYGYISIKTAKIDIDANDRYKISSYLLKLGNHATKLGTGKSFRKKSPDRAADYLGRKFETCSEVVDKLPF